MNRRAALLQKFVHLLAAFTILMKALAKLDHPDGYWPVIALFLIATIYIVLITVFHERLHRHVRLLDASVYAIECVVMGIVAWLSFHEGARWLPYVFSIASAGFAIAFVMRLVRRPRGAADIAAH
jgi:drug/metabolite transporter (DMT)-like permease